MSNYYIPKNLHPTTYMFCKDCNLGDFIIEDGVAQDFECGLVVEYKQQTLRCIHQDACLRINNITIAEMRKDK